MMKKQKVTLNTKTAKNESGHSSIPSFPRKRESRGNKAIRVTGSPIGSGMTKEERSTGMTAEVGSGITPSSASFPRMRESKQADSESGRSMVEMLGVLAIMGVLAIGGIAGYRYAMDKYNANEILNEVRKRAVTASQQRILGRSIDLSEWSNTIQGHPVTTANSYNGDTSFFALTVSGIEQGVCDKVIDEKISFAVEEKVGEVVVGEDTTCAEGENAVTFAFKNTLDGEGATGGEEPEPSDPACEGVECPAGTSCSNGRCLCPTGQEVCGETCCPEGQACSYNLEEGCVPVTGECATNADCDEGEYCDIFSPPGTGMGCMVFAEGTCLPLGDKEEIVINGLGVLSKRSDSSILYWWSANNWCQAQGKRLISLSDLRCDHLEQGGYTDGSGYCCKDSNPCNYDSSTQSVVARELRTQAKGLMWLYDTLEYCGAYGFYSDGSVRQEGVRDYGIENTVICK